MTEADAHKQPQALCSCYHDIDQRQPMGPQQRILSVVAVRCIKRIAAASQGSMLHPVQGSGGSG